MQIRLTEDGSHTIYSNVLDETYHSRHGAIQESEHIFIQAGLSQCTKSSIKILEIGFGTGLNAFLTLLYAEKNNKIVHYTSIEYYPVKKEVVENLNYPDMIDVDKKLEFSKIHQVEWDNRKTITPYFCLQKANGDFTKIKLEDTYDIIYFDAFSPEKQPEMWEQSRFDLLYKHANTGAILTTYCSKGVVRRAMQQAGFKVERLPGPPGKREILRAVKL